MTTRSRLGSAARAALLLAAFASPAACGDDTSAEQRRLATLSAKCTLNSDCRDPLVCVFERCHEQCSTSRDCDAGQRCVRTDKGFSVCQLPDEVSCQSVVDCSGKQLCGPDLECHDACVAAASCVSGQSCAREGLCAEPEELDPDGGLGGAGGSSGSAGTGGGNSGGTGGGTGGTGGTGGGTGGTGGGTGGTGGGTGATGGSGGTGGTSTGGSGGASASGGSGGSGGVTCPTGYAECESSVPTDCETPTTLITSCGGCNVRCLASHADVACVNEQCVATTCTGNYVDCNNTGTDGCEALLDSQDANCGTCGHSCEGGGCVGGLCKPVTVATYSAATGYAASGGGYAFLLGGSYSLVRVPLSGGQAEIVAENSRPCTALTTSATRLYWAVGGNPSAVMSVPLTGPVPLPTLEFTLPSRPYALAVRGSAFYWVGATGVFTRPVTGPTSDPGSPLYSASINPASTLAVTPSHIYWIEGSDLKSLPLAGGTPGAYTAGPTLGADLVAIGSDVYYARGSTSAAGIYRYQAGGTPTLIAAQNYAYSFAIDGNDLFVTLSGQYGLVRGTLTPGGTLAQFGASATWGRVVATDAGHLYTVGTGGNSLFSIPR